MWDKIPLTANRAVEMQQTSQGRLPGDGFRYLMPDGSVLEQHVEDASLTSWDERLFVASGTLHTDEGAAAIKGRALQAAKEVLAIEESTLANERAAISSTEARISETRDMLAK